MEAMGALLLMSEKPADLEFWQAIAKTTQADFHHCHGAPSADGIKLMEKSDTLVLWDAGDETTFASRAGLLKWAHPSRVFAITDQPLRQGLGMFGKPVFGHHIFRSYNGAASFLYAKLVQAALSPEPFGLGRFFPDDAAHENKKLVNSKERAEAIAEIQKFFDSRGVNSRLVALASDAADELIMNAVFDAPRSPTGEPYRRNFDRADAFPLEGREQIEVHYAWSPGFIGVMVADQFGSLDRDVIIKHLAQDFEKEDYHPVEEDKGAGLGLYRINRSSTAMLFMTRPGERTEVMIFIGNEKSIRDFRMGFCFLSTLTEK